MRLTLYHHIQFHPLVTQHKHRLMKISNRQHSKTVSGYLLETKQIKPYAVLKVLFQDGLIAKRIA